MRIPEKLARIERYVMPEPIEFKVREDAEERYYFRNRFIQKICFDRLRRVFMDSSWNIFLIDTGRIWDDRRPTDDLVLFGRFHLPFREVHW